MSRNLVSVTGVAVLLGLTLACTSKSSTPLTPTTPASGTSSTASDGSTLKVTAPTPQSPINDVKPTSAAKLVVSPSTALYVPAIAVNYRFQIFNSANVLVDNSLESGPSYDVRAELVTNSRYTWQARAEAGSDAVGPWSTRASFTAPETAFLRGSEFADPLKNGRTVGQQRGGTFLPGQGWQSLSVYDAIDYDLEAPCADCTLEFDVTNFGKGEGEDYLKDLKWITMGNAADFGDFGAFRNHPWKMHLEQRADGDGTGMKLIWRNGDVGEGEPGDHTGKVDPAIDWQQNVVYHFVLDWAGGSGFTVTINGEEWFADGFGGNEYRPPVHRVSLGCWPRGESFVGVIYSNIRLRKNQ